MRTFRHLALLFGALRCATVVSEAQVCVTDNAEFAWQGSPNTQFYSPFVIGGGCSGFDPANAQAVDRRRQWVFWTEGDVFRVGAHDA